MFSKSIVMKITQKKMVEGSAKRQAVEEDRQWWKAMGKEMGEGNGVN